MLHVGRTEPGTPMSALLVFRRPEANRLHPLPRRLRSLPMQEVSEAAQMKSPISVSKSCVTNRKQTLTIESGSERTDKQRKFFVQIFAVKNEGGDPYRSVIFPADRATEGSLVCEKWHNDESEVVGVLQRILDGTADVAEVLDQAQSIEGWMGKLELTDSEAALLGWHPELLGD
jgi:hypothetical protein